MRQRGDDADDDGGDGDTTGRHTRRRLLATVGTGLATGLAGCGYQPGAGDLEWETNVGGDTVTFSSDRTTFSRGDHLFAVRNQSGRTYDFDAQTWVDVNNAVVSAYAADGARVWSGETDVPYAGTPTADDDAVYVPLEDGRVTALERRGESAGDSLWTTESGESADSTGPALDLAVGTDLVGVRDDGISVIDPDDGTERFALEFEDTLENDSIDATIAAAGSDAAWVATADDESTLLTIDADGVVERSLLPSPATWLVALGESCLVGLEDEIRRVDRDGDRQWSVALEATLDADDPVVVDDRLYCTAWADVLAVDVTAGELLWSRTNPFRNAFVADEDGLYGLADATGRDGCSLLALDRDGDRRWSAETADPPDCSGTPHLLDGRLVVEDGRDLYGFRTEPGDRVSVLYSSH